MSLLSSLGTAVMEGLEGNAGNSGIAGSLEKELLQHFQQNQGGNLNSLVAQLSEKGLGDIVRSWVGTGPNKPVSPDQLSRAMDPNLLGQLAAKLGIPPQMVTTHLAEVLPKVVDRLTPDGKLPVTAIDSVPEGGDFGSAS